MPKNAISQISKSPASESHETAISKWLVKFCAMFDKNLTPLLKATWCEALSDLDVDTINRACLQAERTTEFFPSPGFVRKQISQAEAHAFELCAEREWQRLMTWVRENVFPDTGIRRGAPRLAPAVEHAAKAAGGLIYLERAKEDQLVWCRKTFLAAYKNVHETGQVEHLLGDGAAKQIIRELAAGPQPARSQLAIAAERKIGKPTIGEVREVLDRVTAEKPRPTASDSPADLQKAWHAQKERLAARCAELGIPCAIALPKNPVETEAVTR